MISNRPVELIDLDAHPDFVPVWQILVLILIEQINLKKFDRKIELIAWISNQANQQLTITRQRLGRKTLRIFPGKPAIDRANALARPGFECVLDDRVAWGIECSVCVFCLNLDAHALFANDICFD